MESDGAPVSASEHRLDRVAKKVASQFAVDHLSTGEHFGGPPQVDTCHAGKEVRRHVGRAHVPERFECDPGHVSITVLLIPFDGAFRFAAADREVVLCADDQERVPPRGRCPFAVERCRQENPELRIVSGAVSTAVSGGESLHLAACHLAEDWADKLERESR